MPDELSPAFVTSEDENEGSGAGSTKRRNESASAGQSSEEQSGTPAKKPRLPPSGGSFNLVSYGLDDDNEGASDSDAESSQDKSSASGDADTSLGDSGALHFVASEGGPLTVLSSEHKMSDLQAAIEAAQDSPAMPAEETQDGTDPEHPDRENPDVASEGAAGGDPKEPGVELPPEPEGLCSMQLQQMVETTIRRMQHDIEFDPNRVIQDNKGFRNPSIYKKLIGYLGIDEKGTNISTEVFNPYRWDANSFYDKLGEVQNREVERLEKLRKERRKAEASGAAGVNAAAANLHRAASGPNLSVGAPDGSERPPEMKKKSKWDTVGPPADVNVGPPTVVVDPNAPKVSIPAVGNLFQKK